MKCTEMYLEIHRSTYVCKNKQQIGLCLLLHNAIFPDL